MLFSPYMEISPDYGSAEIATNSYLRDGHTLYLMGSTVLCKYDISDPENPCLLKKADITADHEQDPAMALLRRGSAHSTSIVDLGKYLAISLRNIGGGVANMEDGAIVGALSIIDKETLEKVRGLNFENKVTFITKYRDLLIVSLHFHGFYIYKLTDDAEILSCLFKYIEVERPRSAQTREFQNSAVFEVEPCKINIAMASYKFGINVYTYDLEKNCLSPLGELNPLAFPDMKDPESGAMNKVFGLTAKENFVYGGISPGNNRFRERYQKVDWSRFDKRGIIYGPHDRLEKEHYHLELPDCDKPAYIGAIAGDPAPSFLCVAGNHLLFNLDKQGLGMARIGSDSKLTYLGRALEDPHGRVLTYAIHFDGEFLYTSYRNPLPNAETPHLFRMYRIEDAE